MSAFDRDFGREFGKVEETVLIDDVAVKLGKRFPRNSPEIAQEYRLLVVDPTGQEWECPIRGEVMIGRAEDNDISVEDRAVSRHHMAINTDGKLFWYQDLNSGNGTQVNNEFVTEGWLTGGEEIVVGNSRIYFMVPDDQAAAAAAAEEAALAANAEDVLQDPQVADPSAQASSDALPQAPILVAPEKGSEESEGSFVGLIVLLVAVIAVGGVGFWAYRRYNKAPVEKKLTPLEMAIGHFNRGKQLMKEQKWNEADQALRMAASITDGNPMRPEILRYVRLVSKELSAQNMLKRARSLYIDEDKASEAMVLLAKISTETEAFIGARKLKRRIYKKDINPKLAAANLALAANQPDLAKKHLLAILKIDPEHKEALALKQKIEAGPVVQIEEKPPERRASRRYSRRRSGPSGNIKQGIALYNTGRFANAIIYFRRLQSSGGSRRTRKTASKYRRYVADFQRYVNIGMSAAASGNADRAITNLQRAARADRSLGGGRRSQYARTLARVLHRRGKTNLSRKKYMAAFRDLKEASRLDPINAVIKSSLTRVREGAKKMLEEAQVLKDVDNNEAKRLLMQVMRILPSSDPLHRKAKQLLN
ncbi:MAG: FHA domain-containing protein [Myxococcales bacterium]|nr:FHA domain-containing protein [Myxococcales bacterium]